MNTKNIVTMSLDYSMTLDRNIQKLSHSHVNDIIELMVIKIKSIHMGMISFT